MYSNYLRKTFKHTLSHVTKLFGEEHAEYASLYTAVFQLGNADTFCLKYALLTLYWTYLASFCFRALGRMKCVCCYVHPSLLVYFQLSLMVKLTY